MTQESIQQAIKVINAFTETYDSQLQKLQELNERNRQDHTQFMINTDQVFSGAIQE